MLSKKIMIPIFAVVVTGAALVSSSQMVHAQSATTTTLVQMIAAKFGLDQGQVQSVFDQYKTQRQTAMQQRMKTRLDQLVTQGKITATQETDIINELAKLKSEYNPASTKSMTADQRKQLFQQRQTEIKAWMATEGLSASVVIPGLTGMHHMDW